MKAIIPIAGLGTRLLPITKVIPKAMIPILGVPCVQWIVEELAEAGIRDIVFVHSKGQEMVEDYFSKKTWYEEELEVRGKTEAMKKLERIRNLARFEYVLQERQLGDGHAILQAKQLISASEPFLVIFGDCLYTGDSLIRKMLDHYDEKKSSLIAVQKVPRAEAQHFGIASLGNDGRVNMLVEKPSELELKNWADSPVAIIGRYLLTPAIWSMLERQVDKSGEIRLIDALQELHRTEEIFAVEGEGKWLDTGTIEGLSRAGIELGMACTRT